MPRKARITAPGIVHHIMARGLDGIDIFRKDNDRRFFLTQLEKCLHRNNFKCYAWVLLRNHYHLLVRTSEQPLSSFMRWLNSVYASYINREYKRKGYLFQDRYKSIATQDQRYIEEIVRYIHLNPIRAHVCRSLQSLDAYPWSGHAALVGKVDNKFQDIRDVLKRFGGDTKKAIAKYRQYIQEGIGRENNDDVVTLLRKSNAGSSDRHQTGCWVIGDHEFVKKVLGAAEEKKLRIHEYRKKGWSIDLLAERVGKKMGISVKKIGRRWRGGVGSDARKAISFLGHRVLGIPVMEIARYFNVSGPAVSMNLDEGENIAGNHGLNNLII